MGLPRHAPPGPTPRRSLVTDVFGGSLAGTVTCRCCGNASRRLDPMLGLHVDPASSLERGLARFSAPDAIEGYRCPREGEICRALRTLTIAKAPLVLSVQLKRFSFSGFGKKITRDVSFPLVLDLGPAMDPQALAEAPHFGKAPTYDLCGVVVHAGRSAQSGHYIAYVRAPDGLWWLADDDLFRQVGQATVLKQQAYLLFYARRDADGAGKRVRTDEDRKVEEPERGAEATPADRGEDEAKAKKKKKEKTAAEAEVVAVSAEPEGIAPKAAAPAVPPSSPAPSSRSLEAALVEALAKGAAEKEPIEGGRDEDEAKPDKAVSQREEEEKEQEEDSDGDYEPEERCVGVRMTAGKREGDLPLYARLCELGSLRSLRAAEKAIGHLYFPFCLSMRKG